ncbi:histidinol-phosphate transaminase [Orenia metallireducens]|uniref:Histidinol-phosphate aminotransferase n=1 Tax=Orenia metallireducens TaxID=1413210 RepID=A0A1C0A723_9FIRM|nr:histidinol-phosphate transaminase [Orenia metallireducens]OCL26065.1 histidinol-phosphate transaminase [Orenia metallireducens]
MVDKIVVRKEIMDIKPYVPGKPIDEVKRELGLKEVIKLASNENPLGPSPMAIDKMKEAITKVNIYPDGNVHNLREKLSKSLGIEASQLIFGNGSDELLVLLAQAFIKPDDEVVMADITFSEYEFATKIMGGKIIEVPLKNNTHDLEAMLAAVTDKTKMVFICNPNNPTGTIVGRREVEGFLAKVPEDVIVVFDEAYYEYVDNSDYPQTINYLNDYDNVIILRTFSKIYGLGGLRLGYGISSSKLISYIDRVRQPFNINSIAQVAAEASLDDQDHVSKSLEYNRQGKEYLYQEFERLGLEYVPTETNFILIDLGRSNQEVFQKMLKKGIIIRSLASYGYETEARVTIGLPEENKKMIKALEEVLS